MEARSQLRHRPILKDTILLVAGTSFILADSRKIVNASPGFQTFSTTKDAKGHEGNLGIK